MKIFKYNQKGFTLVELLIVVAIIAILSTLLMVNFIGIRQRARDAERKSSLRQIQSAFELYRADQNSYPTALGTCIGVPDCTNTANAIYMKNVPTDPNGSSWYNSGNYYYYTPDSGGTYYLVACLENTSDKDQNATATLPSGISGSPGNCSSNFYYVLQNP